MLEAAVEAAVDTAVLEPTEAGAEAVPSTETLVEEMALITVLWKRAGMDMESCVVGGRMRSAGVIRVRYIACMQPEGKQTHTNLHRGRCTVG